MRVPKSVNIFTDNVPDNLRIESVVDYFSEIVPKIPISYEGDIVDRALCRCDDAVKSENAFESIARMFAEAKVRDVHSPFVKFEPMYGEVGYEKRRLKKRSEQITGVLYDGARMTDLFRSFLPAEMNSFDSCAIIITNQLLTTYDLNDLRHHIRAGIYAFPSIVSTSGIVEGPAKPREFYLMQNEMTSGISPRKPIEAVKKQFEGRFIDYGDSRLTEVAKGYVMQAFVFHLTGNPFCADRSCRLFNAHWQEEMILTQLTSPGDFCTTHYDLLSQITPGK